MVLIFAKEIIFSGVSAHTIYNCFLNTNTYCLGPYVQGRSEKVWGPDAKQFRPERWITPEGELKRESQGQWPAFHAGPRVCLGQHLATLEALIAIIFLVKRYKFTLMAGQEITYQVSLTLPMRYGMKVMVERRNKD